MVQELITEMQALKAEYSSLEISDVLRIFSIQALRDLTKELKIMRQKQ